MFQTRFILLLHKFTQFREDRTPRCYLFFFFFYHVVVLKPHRTGRCGTNVVYSDKQHAVMGLLKSNYFHILLCWDFQHNMLSGEYLVPLILWSAAAALPMKINSTQHLIFLQPLHGKHRYNVLPTWSIIYVTWRTWWSAAPFAIFSLRCSVIYQSR